MIAEIAVAAATYAFDKPYSYWIPAGMCVRPGQRVSVPFGRGNRRTEGIVLRVGAGEQEGLKPVEALLDAEPILDDTMLRLAAFMRERYFCTFFDAVRAMLPAGMWFSHRKRYQLKDGITPEMCANAPQAASVTALLCDLGGGAAHDTLRAAVDEETALEEALSYLLKKRWITAQTDFLRRSGDKTERIASLAASAEEAMEYAASRPKRAAMQRAVVETLCSVGSISVKELCYYTGASSATIKNLEKAGLIVLTQQPVLRCRELKPAKLNGELYLNGEQQAACAGLAAQMAEQNPGVALLYGVTGSGKTAVYIKLIRLCLEQGRSAMLLVPEIALTPQLLSLLAAHFTDQVAVLHSSLPAGERYDQWKRVRSGDARVVVGTRSAVFAPLQRPGLLILDEEQEHTYKSENSPRYCAREVAMWRGSHAGAMVLFGSATPSIETMYRAKTGVYRLYMLKNRYNGRPLPKVDIVDLAQELRDGNDSPVSRVLQKEIVDTAKAGKQTVLFLNRRGNSRSMICVNCGQTPECPRCSERLTYHSANERLMCHYCGFSQRVPQRCPHCGAALKRVGVGTQKVEQELCALLPGQEIIRMDADTVSASNTHEKILNRFTREHIPVLVGTQMVTKGLNLPNVTLVGVLDADLSLYSEGFRSAETTFDLLTQVVGRAGRGEAEGRAMIQTLVPAHPVVKLAAVQDYDGFYELELRLRRAQGCLPFGDEAVITFTGQEEGRVLRCAVSFRERLLASWGVGAPPILGPAPCAVPKINYNFRYRLTVRCRMERPIRRILGQSLRDFLADSGNRGVSAFVDINGYG